MATSAQLRARSFPVGSMTPKVEAVYRDSTAETSNTPTSKSIVIRLEPASR
jgi:hypothetical protein